MPNLSLLNERLVDDTLSALLFAQPGRAFEVPYSEIELGSLIGTGGFGHVHHAVWRAQPVVLRELRREQRKEARQLVALLAQV